MKRLIFVNRFFSPDQSATSQILSDLAFHLSAEGFEVHIVTSRQLYNNPNIQLSAWEWVRGVHVHRLRTTRFGRAGLLGRATDYLSFYLSMWLILRRFVRSGDVIISKTDPQLLSIPALWIARAP